MGGKVDEAELDVGFVGIISNAGSVAMAEPTGASNPSKKAANNSLHLRGDPENACRFLPPRELMREAITINPPPSRIYYGNPCDLSIIAKYTSVVKAVLADEAR